MNRVNIESKRCLLDDVFKVEEAILSYEQFNGQMSQPVRRLNFKRGNSAGAIVFNVDSQSVLLTHQFRYPTYETSSGWLLEIIAGIVEPTEKPEETIRREVLEESGYEIEQLTPISNFYLSPGGSSEQLFLYYAAVSNKTLVKRGGGLASEAEDIQIVEYPLEEVWMLLDNNQIMDAKTIIALMWLKEKLRR
jgi:ADP-ribose pyrophosphatase